MILVLAIRRYVEIERQQRNCQLRNCKFGYLSFVCIEIIFRIQRQNTNETMSYHVRCYVTMLRTHDYSH